MRGTTIFRSSRLAGVAVAVVVAAAAAAPVAAAQDTTRAGQDTARAGAELGPLPTSHTVVRGESLWAIAQVYFGDPLLWPEIYRLNTAVVEDPHWIYPGEVLVLNPQFLVRAPGDTLPPADAGADTMRVEGADTIVVAPGDTLGDTAQFVVVEPPPEATEGYETIFDRRHSQTEDIQRLLRAYAEQPYRPVRRGEFYAAGFLTEEERLPWGRVLGSTARPAIFRLSPNSSATTFQEIALEAPGNASYHVGDSVLIARVDRPMVGWGEVVVPHGVAQVTEVQERQVLAQVVMQFARIRNGNLALPLEPFRDPGEVRPTPVEQGLEARVVGPRDLHALLGQQQFLFIDRGRGEGVTPGDLFEVYRPAVGEPGSSSEQVMATLLIVHTRERSATGLIIGIQHPAIAPGMPVRLIRKMPS